MFVRVSLSRGLEITKHGSRELSYYFTSSPASERRACAIVALSFFFFEVFFIALVVHTNKRYVCCRGDLKSFRWYSYDQTDVVHTYVFFLL